MWRCEGKCYRGYPDEVPAYGWIGEPYCGPCFHAMEATVEGEPSLQQVAECERLLAETDG